MINKHNKLEKELHRDIQKLICSKKYGKISADKCMVIFGRVYSSHCTTQLEKEGKIKIVIPKDICELCQKRKKEKRYDLCRPCRLSLRS